MSFSEALYVLKEYQKVARAGWNGKGMWIALASDIQMGAMTEPFIYMSTAQDGLVPWLASQTDILAEDWGVV